MSDKEIIRYAFLSDFVKESSEEEIINKLIELDDKQKEKDNKINQLESVIDKAIEYLKRKEKEPEWYDTDFMICINILNGGSGNFEEVLKEDYEIN